MPKNYYLSFILVSLLFVSAYSQINIQWESRHTSAGFNVDAAKAIALDDSNNVYVTGTSYVNTTSGFDIVTIKYNNAGVQQWMRTYSGAGNGIDEGRDIYVDANRNTYVCGYMTNGSGNFDYITIKYDPSGTQLWATAYNGTANGFDEAYALVVDNSTGDVFVTGGAAMTSQSTNMVTLKYNSSGAQQNLVQYNGTPASTAIDNGLDIFMDAAKNIYVTGYATINGQDLNYVTMKYNNSLGAIWGSPALYNGTGNLLDIPSKVVVDNSGNVYVTGASYGGQLFDLDFLTIKYNSAGTQQWVRRYDGAASEEDKALDMLVDNNGDVYITGRVNGPVGESENIVTIKYSTAGNQLWLNQYNGPASQFDEGNSIKQGKNGDIYVTGFSRGIGTNNDYLTLKHDSSNGNIIWEARFDGPASNSDQAAMMALDTADNVYVTGKSKDPITNFDYSTIKWCQFETFGPNDKFICVGDSVQLSPTASGATGWSWTPTTGLSNPNIRDPYAKPTVTTTYFVTATNGTGCSNTDTIVVTVNSLPSNGVTPVGSTTFCMGDSLQLVADSSDNYNWSNGDTTRTTYVYSTGTYTVTISDTVGCAAQGQISVTVNPLPNVSVGPDVRICLGDSAQLNATGATSYTWSTQNGLSDSTIANPWVNISIAQTYFVWGTDANNCTGVDTITVFVDPVPTAAFSQSADTIYLNKNTQVAFFDQSINPASWNWSFGDGGTSTQKNPIHTYSTPGVYTVKLVVNLGNCKDSITSTVWVFLTDGLENHSLIKEFNVYPNPTKNMLNITSDVTVLNNVIVTLYTVDGREVKKENLGILTGKTNHKFDVSDLYDGSYILILSSEEERIVRKIQILK